MTIEEIKSCLQTDWIGRQIQYFRVTDSTNNRAKALGEKGAPHGMLVLAEGQRAGRGRRGRNWNSPYEDNIYMTLLLRPHFMPELAPMLTLVMAYAAAQAIEEKENLKVRIKWPNDLVVGQKKICGILTEMSAEVGKIAYVIIGVGINVNTERFPRELQDMATSIRMEIGEFVQKEELIAGVMKRFERYYEQFCAAGNLQPILEEYNRRLLNCGQQVRVLEPGKEYRARALKINEKGELLVEKEDGSKEAVFAGEVSVRGIYGYV